MVDDACGGTCVGVFGGLGAVEARLEREDPRERSLRGLVEDLAERCVQVELVEEASFFNANTPDDLEALSELDPDTRPQDQE